MTIFPFETVSGLLTNEDKQNLAMLSRQCAAIPGDYAEIGSNQGLSSLCILSGMPASKLLWCYDYFDESVLIPFNKNLSEAGMDRRVRVFRGDFRVTLKRDAPGQIAFAFIDHDHRWETTVAAYAMLWPLLSPGGILAFHDYGHPDYPEPKPFIDILPHKRVLNAFVVAFQKE